MLFFQRSITGRRISADSTGRILYFALFQKSIYRQQQIILLPYFVLSATMILGTVSNVAAVVVLLLGIVPLGKAATMTTTSSLINSLLPATHHTYLKQRDFSSSRLVLNGPTCFALSSRGGSKIHDDGTESQDNSSTPARDDDDRNNYDPTGNTFDTWDNVQEAIPDSILGIAQAYRHCTNPNKVNICVGAYRTEHGEPYILPSVQEAERRMMETPPKYDKEYLPIEGDSEYIQSALRFAYGDDIDLSCFAAVQALSGTGACRIGGHYLYEQYCIPQNEKMNAIDNDKGVCIYIPTPTWNNHYNVFQKCNIPTKSYRYYDPVGKKLDYEGLIEDIESAPDGSIILLHACAHNPTGCDPTPTQWEHIRNVIERKHHVVFLDSAYQGFATGDSEQDGQTIRMFAKSKTIPMLLAQSFAKNFGLYGERVGLLSIKCNSKQQSKTIVSQLKSIIRPMYSSPPKHGSTIVKIILNDPVLYQQYKQECNMMSNRISQMRTLLVQTLQDVGSIQDWTHILSPKQIGMFAYTGLTPAQVDQLTNDHYIFMTRDGRISLAGLNAHNVQYVANAIHSVTK